IPILTEQFKVQSEAIYPRDYSSLIFGVVIPSRDIAFIYGLGNYVLPIMLISSWILTVSMLRSYASRVGKKVFLANPAYSDEKNTNARNQNCEISSNQILYLTLYPGECSAFEAKESSVSKLLECAIDSNRVIKLNQVKVDGKDVSSNIISQRTTRPFNFVIPSVNVDAAEPSTPGKVNPSMAENYYLFFKPLPAGHHTIEAELIRQPLQSNQPVEQHTTKWNVNVSP
ncbi:MAG: hypothetical protein WBQ25_04920, partial [Nitrososphaeraceae archaeon]